MDWYYRLPRAWQGPVALWAIIVLFPGPLVLLADFIQHPSASRLLSNLGTYALFALGAAVVAVVIGFWSEAQAKRDARPPK